MSKLPKNWRDLHAYESNYLGSWDLNEDKDTIATISKCVVEDVSNGKTSDKLLVLYFKQFDKGVVMNRTNLKAVEIVAGSSNPADWVGVRVSLYIQMVKAFGETKPAIRIRNAAPPKPKKVVFDVEHKKTRDAMQAINSGRFTVEQVLNMANWTEAAEKLLRAAVKKTDADADA